MRQLLAFGIGMLARFVALLAEHFARWLLHQIRDGKEAGADLLSELRDFGEWFLQMLAGQLCRRPARQFNGYESEYDYAR
jgi:hypothetical protein